jgi:hypothetical protein
MHTVVDRQRFNADPDLTVLFIFNAGSDPDPDPTLKLGQFMTNLKCT